MPAETNKEIQIRMLATAWSDQDFENKLRANPTAVCREQGMEFEGEMRISDNEAAPNIFYLPPPPPGSGGMTEVEFQQKASDFIRSDKEMF